MFHLPRFCWREQELFFGRNKYLGIRVWVQVDALLTSSHFLNLVLPRDVTDITTIVFMEFINQQTSLGVLTFYHFLTPWSLGYHHERATSGYDGNWIGATIPDRTFQLCETYSGWWFGTWMDYFPFHIWVVIVPIDFHIFQRGRSTTNQIIHHHLPSLTIINHH